MVEGMKGGGVFWPVFLILVGVIILMVNVGVLPSETWKFWPLIFVFLGLIKLAGFETGEEQKKK